VQAALVLNIIILEDRKLIFNCNASGILPGWSLHVSLYLP